MSHRLRALTVATLLVASALLSAVVLPAGAATADASISIDYDGDEVTVANAESQVISGTADLAPGTSLSVRVRSTGDTTPGFFQTETVAVDRNGTWAAAFDFAEQSANDTFTVTVRAEEAEATADGEVVGCAVDCTDPEPEPVETVRLDTTDGSVRVNDSAAQLLSGSALAPTGTEVSLRIRSTDSEAPFFKAASAVVTEDGTWSTTANFSTASPGDEFSVEATIDGDYVARAAGEVVACDRNCRDQPPTDTPTPIPEPTPEGTATPAGASVEFTRSVVPVERGETARLRLSFEDTDTAEFVFGGEASGYVLRATVRDADGDGDASLRIDTAAAGDEAGTLTVSEGDEVVVDSETRLRSPLAEGEYELSLSPGEAGADTPSDIGVLSLTPPATATPDGSPATVTATPTATPASDDGTPVTGIVVSGALVLGGGAVATLLLRG